MAINGGILEQIGERSLLLPELINRGFEAHDRLKYYLTLLQTAYGYARSPGGQVPDLHAEREAAGVIDESLDHVVAASRAVTPTSLHIPGAAAIIEQVFADVRHMLEPVVTSAAMHGEVTERAAVYMHRLDEQIMRVPPCMDDQISSAALDALTKVTSNGHDSMHQLMMDLQWELNRLEASVNVEVLDGAHVYGLNDTDRHCVRAFMKGVNETSPLKFDHPGLDTTATRDGDHLSIHNDLGTTDEHVLVIHVTGLVATLIYTDVHRARARFVRDLLEPHRATWSQPDGTGPFETSTGTYTAADQNALDQFLTHVGSRLVFLIDWNRARKKLARLVRKSDAVHILKWAADNNVGHQAFLQAGDLGLIHTALDRAAPSHVHYAMRLDEILGRVAANRFLMSVLRIASAGVSRRCSPRLIDDEVEAELLTYLQRSDRTLLGAVSEHAMVVAGMVEWIRRAVEQLRAHHAADSARTATLIRTWRADADAIIRKARRTVDHVEHGAHLRRLLSQGARVVKILEEAAFMLTLVPEGIDAGVAALLDELADLASRAVREYVRCLEDARDLSRGAPRLDLERFLLTVDRLTTLEDCCDETERAVRERVLSGPLTDFRQVYTISELTRKLDRATDSVVQSGLLVRDYVLSVAPGA